MDKGPGPFHTPPFSVMDGVLMWIPRLICGLLASIDHIALTHGATSHNATLTSLISDTFQPLRYALVGLALTAHDFHYGLQLF